MKTNWLRATYLRCCEWVRALLGPSRLILHLGTGEIGESEYLGTCASARMTTLMRIRQETPIGIARLARILAERAHDTSV